MEKLLVEKLDLMCDRMTKGTSDNLVLIDGDEGTGKSTLASEICYYVAHKCKREFNLSRVFFDLDELMSFALRTKEQIIDWDEGALGGLSVEWWKKNQIKFLKLLMVARKRKHFFVICIPKFFKLSEYLVVDRSMALIHVYERNQLEKGRFIYFSKGRKERLWQDWKKSKFRNYKKLYNFHGSFPDAFAQIIDADEYDKKKDMAILSIDKDDDKIDERTLRKRFIGMAVKRMDILGIKLNQSVLCDIFDVSEKTLRAYKNEYSDNSLEREVGNGSNINNRGGWDQIDINNVRQQEVEDV
jgi:hypothetical protein